MQNAQPAVNPCLVVTYGLPKAFRFSLKCGLDQSIHNRILCPDLQALKIPLPSLKRSEVIADGCVRCGWKEGRDDVFINALEGRMSDHRRINSEELRRRNIIRIDLHVNGKTYWLEAPTEGNDNTRPLNILSTHPFNGLKNLDHVAMGAVAKPEPPSSPKLEPSTSSHLKRKRDTLEDEDLDPLEDSGPSVTRKSSRQAARDARLRIRQELGGDQDELREVIREVSSHNSELIASVEALKVELAEEKVAHQAAEQDYIRVREELRLEKEGQKQAEASLKHKHGIERQQLIKGHRNKDMELQVIQKRFQEVQDDHKQTREYWTNETRRLRDELKEVKEDRDWVEDRLDAEREKRAEEQEACRVLREQYRQLQDEYEKKDEALQKTRLALDSAAEKVKEAQAAARATCVQLEERKGTEEEMQLRHKEDLAHMRDEMKGVEASLRNVQDRLDRSEETIKLKKKAEEMLEAKCRELEEMLRVEKAEREKSDGAFHSLQEDCRRLEVEGVEREDILRETRVELEVLRKRVSETNVQTTTADGVSLRDVHGVCSEGVRRVEGFGVQSVLGHLYR